MVRRRPLHVDAGAACWQRNDLVGQQHLCGGRISPQRGANTVELHRRRGGGTGRTGHHGRGQGQERHQPLELRVIENLLRRTLDKTDGEGLYKVMSALVKCLSIVCIICVSARPSEPAPRFASASSATGWGNRPPCFAHGNAATGCSSRCAPPVAFACTALRTSAGCARCRSCSRPVCRLVRRRKRCSRHRRETCLRLRPQRPVAAGTGLGRSASRLHPDAGAVR